MTTAEGEQLAKRLKCQFIETSAKTRVNIEDAFYNLVRAIPRHGTEYRLVAVGSGGVGKVLLLLIIDD